MAKSGGASIYFYVGAGVFGSFGLGSFIKLLACLKKKNKKKKSPKRIFSAADPVLNSSIKSLMIDHDHTKTSITIPSAPLIDFGAEEEKSHRLEQLRHNIIESVI